jgi:ADP-ribosyl-[dinitrogen reductase] hydrolase
MNTGPKQINSVYYNFSIFGCILGTAVGDALGLPYEGLNPRRAARLFGPPDRHHFFFGHGMVSDDTEHACFTAKALIESRLDPIGFERSLARSLRWWLASIPAGVGKATAMAILKMWVGFGPDKSGVFSAGNGPAMRSPILGVVFADNPKLMKEYVKRSTRMTHSDPKAYWGALCAALTAAISSKGKQILPSEFFASIEILFKNETADDFISLIRQVCQSAENNESTETFAVKIGCTNGISGYMLHTVPCVIQT